MNKNLRGEIAAMSETGERFEESPALVVRFLATPIWPTVPLFPAVNGRHISRMHARRLATLFSAMSNSFSYLWWRTTTIMMIAEQMLCHSMRNLDGCPVEAIGMQVRSHRSQDGTQTFQLP